MLQTAVTQRTATEHSHKLPVVSNRTQSLGNSGLTEPVSLIHLSQGTNVKQEEKITNKIVLPHPIIPSQIMQQYNACQSKIAH